MTAVVNLVALYRYFRKRCGKTRADAARLAIDAIRPIRE